MNFSPEQEEHDYDIENYFIPFFNNHNCKCERTGIQDKYRDDLRTLGNLSTTYHILEVQEEKSLADLFITLPTGYSFSLDYVCGGTFEAFKYAFAIKHGNTVFVVKDRDKRYVLIPTKDILFNKIRHHNYEPWLNNKLLPHNDWFLRKYLDINNFEIVPRNNGSRRSNDPYVWLKDKPFTEFESWMLDNLVFKLKPI